MQKASRDRSGVGREIVKRGRLGKRAGRTHLSVLEALESRVVLSYTFSYDPITQVAFVTGSTGTDSLVISPIGGDLDWSVNGSAFNSTWGGRTVPASASTIVDTHLESGDGATLQLGGDSGANAGGPASDLLAEFLVIVPFNTSDTCSIDDSGSTTAGTYTIDLASAPGTITGPGINYVESSSVFGGGVSIEGAAVNGDVYNVLSTASFPILGTEPVNVMTPDTSTVNIGSTGGAGSMARVQAPISVVGSTSSAALNFHDENDTTGQTWTLDNDDGAATGSVAVTGSATTTYDPAELSALTVDGGSGGNTFTVDDTSANYATTLFTGTGDNNTSASATGDSALDIHGQGGTDTVTLGGLAGVGMQNLSGTVSVDNALGLTALTLDDSEDTSGQTATLTDNGTTGSVTGLSPATINYTDADMSSLTIDASNAGGNTFDVHGTLANPTSPVTTIDKGTGSGNSVTIFGTNANSVLDLTGGAGNGTDTVTFMGAGPFLGTFNNDEVPGSTSMVIDLTNDGLPHDFVLSSDGTTTTLADLDGNYPTTTFPTATVSSLTIDTDPGFDQTLNVNMGGGGNPIPTGSATGLIFNADGDGTSTVTPAGTHALNITGELASGPFASETHNANQESVFPQVGQYGSIDFTDSTGASTGLNYTGLQPITDTTPAVSYTFNDFGYPDQSFSATYVAPYVQFTNIPTPPTPLNFETTDISNKVNVTFNTPPFSTNIPGNGVFGLVNIPTASAGLASLTFNTNTANNNTVAIVATPPAVATTVYGSTADDITNVTGTGVASGTTLTLDAGPGTNTLNYNAGGLVPTITPGSSPDEVLISVPGAGTVDAFYYSSINISDTAPVAPVAGAAVSVKAVESVPLINALVGTFTFPLASLFPAGTVLPAGLPATDFTATINWGDGSATTAGTITQDTANPSNYDVFGTHTYATAGSYTISVTVNLANGVATGLVGTAPSVPVTITLPVAPATGTSVTLAPTTVAVADGTLTVTAFPIVGTEGAAIAAAPIATFIDSGGPDPIGDYSATITITDAAGHTVVSVSAASITQVGSSDQFTVNAPAFTLPEEGTYQVLVTVTDTAPPTSYSSSGTSQATIADAPLTTTGLGQPTVTQDEPTIFPLPVFSPPLFSGQVAVFHDDNPLPPTGSSSAADFTATIDWGDGTPPTAGAIVPLLGSSTYEVTGSHTYASAGKAGTYPIQVFVTDVGGSKLTITNTATVTVNPISVTGAINPASVSGLSNGDAAVTKVTQPDFSGTVWATLPGGAKAPEGYADVSLTATNVATGVATSIGSVQAGSDGAWNIKSSVALPDGTYSITATAVDQFGQTNTTTPNVITSSIQIDTVGPVITSMFFNRLNGEVDFTIRDPGDPSGVAVSTLLNSSNYVFTKVHANKAYPGKWIVTNVSVTPGSAPNSYDVAVVFNSGKPIRGGFYLFTIRDSSNGNSSVQDMAGNHLDGVFYGSFPSGNGVNGSDFVAELSGYHNKIFAPQTIVGTASNANGGAGGAPVGAVHSGNHSPVVPRGGGSVFGSDRKHLKGTDLKAGKKTKPAIKTKDKVRATSTPAGHSSTKATLHDLAIMALVETAKKK